jgi:hypothetical protein
MFFICSNVRNLMAINRANVLVTIVIIAFLAGAGILALYTNEMKSTAKASDSSAGANHETATPAPKAKSDLQEMQCSRQTQVSRDDCVKFFAKVCFSDQDCGPLACKNTKCSLP